MKKACFAVMTVLSVSAVRAEVTGVEFIQDKTTRRVRVNYTLDAPAVVTVDFRTNGVSIGAANFRNATGDVNRYVKAPGGSIEWDPTAPGAWPGYRLSDGSFSAVVTAWATNAPPDYMAVDLLTPSNVLFYVSEDALPEPVTNEIWKTDVLLMKRIRAANVIWRMGSPLTETGRSATKETPHLVSLTSDYYIGVYKVTQHQYPLISGGTKPSFSYKGPLVPANMVKLSALRGTEYSWPGDGHKVTSGSAMGCLRAHSGIDSFDLPTEAQWEYACRAGTGTRSYDGTEGTATLTNLCWYSANSSEKMHPVGLKLPNRWGLYDMYGNSFDLCLDWYADAYIIAGPVTVDPTGPDSGKHLVSRGGSKDHAAAYSRSAARNTSDPEGDSYYQALRLVCGTGISF